MWGGWALRARDAGSTARRAGRSPATSSRRSGSTRSAAGSGPAAPLAIATMAEIARARRRRHPALVPERRRGAARWSRARGSSRIRSRSAVPLADLAALVRRAPRRRPADRGRDDRRPRARPRRPSPASASGTTWSRARLRRRRRSGAKPDPAMVLAICAALGVARSGGRRWSATRRPTCAMGRAAGAGRVIGVLTGVGRRGRARAGRGPRPRRRSARCWST